VFEGAPKAELGIPRAICLACRKAGCRLARRIRYDGGMLTKWQMLGIAILVVGAGFMLRPLVAAGNRAMVPFPLSVVTAGLALTAIGAFILWITRNARRPPTNNSQN
jgi:hypothetical protein